ncbi:MAG: ribonuclease P protein component [Flavobacteriales bacterium]|nr:ribonuclease P protein component [Flavobacteriales bacterium]
MKLTQISELETDKKVRSFSFPKEEKLCLRKLIGELYEKGVPIKSPAIIFLHMRSPLPAKVPSQVLFTASKRNFKRAHDRNRIKRLMREAYRLHKHVHNTVLAEHGKQAALMFIFTGRNLPDFDYVNSKIRELLMRYASVLAQEKKAEEKSK